MEWWAAEEVKAGRARGWRQCAAAPELRGRLPAGHPLTKQFLGHHVGARALALEKKVPVVKKATGEGGSYRRSSTVRGRPPRSARQTLGDPSLIYRAPHTLRTGTGRHSVSAQNTHISDKNYSTVSSHPSPRHPSHRGCWRVGAWFLHHVHAAAFLRSVEVTAPSTSAAADAWEGRARRLDRHAAACCRTSHA